jgi:hypothetical protein
LQIVIALRYWGVGPPNKCLAVAANDCQEAAHANIMCPKLAAVEKFDAAIVTLLSLQLVTMFIIWMGYEG